MLLLNDVTIAFYFSFAQTHFYHNKYGLGCNSFPLNWSQVKGYEAIIIELLSGIEFL